MKKCLTPRNVKSPFGIVKTLIGSHLSFHTKENAFKLLALFMYYSHYADQMNISSMQLSNFHRLLIDADIEN